MDPLLARLSSTVPAARSLEQLTRPLLQMLGVATGLESTYLTTIDLLGGRQQVRFALNQGALQIPEGLSVPWEDTLCKRALDEGITVVDDVPERWGDSEAAKALGIQTYVSAPVRGENGELLGTLCAAGGERMHIQGEAESLLQLFSTLVGGFIERERLLIQLQQANERLSTVALSDALTGLPNRRALFDELHRLLSRAVRERSSVLIGVIDLDGFKAINDGHGHQTGDLFLQSVSLRLAGGLRGTDMLGRVGGDEFLVIGPGPALSGVATGPVIDHGEPAQAARSLEQRYGELTRGEYLLGSELQLNYAGASAGFVAVDPRGLADDEAVQLADVRMYEVKRTRKANGAPG